MKVEQRLSSGLMVRQDVRQAVRFVMFETGVEGWDYATHGGALGEGGVWAAGAAREGPADPEPPVAGAGDAGA